MSTTVIQSNHILGYCALCRRDRVLCAKCGNNCCNGTYGGEPGNWCTDCPEAYDHQDAFWKDKGSVIFAKDVREEEKVSGEKVLKDLVEKGMFLRV